MPAFKIYDKIRFTYINYLMFVQSPGIRSKVCNTDQFGLRFNFDHNLFSKKQYLRNVWNLIKINLTKNKLLF